MTKQMSSDEVEISMLKSQINVLNLALHHLYTNCPITPARALKLNPHMLGDDDDKCWMKTDSVFNVLALYGFDENYLNELDKKFGVDDG